MVFAVCQFLLEHFTIIAVIREITTVLSLKEQVQCIRKYWALKYNDRFRHHGHQMLLICLSLIEGCASGSEKSRDMTIINILLSSLGHKNSFRFARSYSKDYQY